MTETIASAALDGPPVPQVGRARRRWNASMIIGLALVLLIVVAAVVSFFWTPYDATRVDSKARMMGPALDHLLGTDKFGRDVLSQLMIGSRTTLFVGIVSVGVGALVGVPLGIMSGMSKGLAGEFNMRANDLLLAFPTLLLAIMLAAVFGGSTYVAMIAIGFASIPLYARLLRGGTLQVMQTQYILAARVAGRRPASIAFHHVLPNVFGLVIIQTSVLFGIAILAEAALAFLGLGTPAPTPSWGRMLQESQAYLWNAPRLALFPGIAIAIAVMGFNLLGDGLRDMLDPRQQGRR